MKPEASCQGKGIFLTKSLQDINYGDHYVIQKYLTNPLLMEGLKFDLRLYVLVLGVNPLRAFIYKDGLSRLATIPYKNVSLGNMEELCMHLTNYAVNKNSENFIQNQNANLDSVGHKRSLKYTMRYLNTTCKQDS